MQQEWFWGTTLTSATTEYRWLPTFSEADDSADSVDVDIDEQENATKTLAITMAVLGPDVPDGEIQELELVTKNVRETEVTVTVAVLVGGRIYNQQMALELPCVAAKLRLKRGSGPVHLIGKEFVDHDIDPEEDDIDDEEDEVEVEEEEDEGLSNGAAAVAAAGPAKTDSKKRRLAPQLSNGKSTNGTKVKRTKTEPPEEEEEEECDEDEDMDEDEEEEEEEKLPVKAKKTTKKAVGVKKTPTKEAKKAPKKKPAAKKTPKVKA